MTATPRPGVPVRGSETGRPIMALFDMASRRWTLRVIWELSRVGEPLTFRELRSRCAEMSSSVLTRRIAELREARLVTRDARGYLLTELGRDLVTSMQPLLDWSKSWAAELAPPAEGSPRVSAAQIPVLTHPAGFAGCRPPAGRTEGTARVRQVRGPSPGAPSENLDPPIPPTNPRRGALDQAGSTD